MFLKRRLPTRGTVAQTARRKIRRASGPRACKIISLQFSNLYNPWIVQRGGGGTPPHRKTIHPQNHSTPQTDFQDVPGHLVFWTSFFMSFLMSFWATLGCQKAAQHAVKKRPFVTQNVVRKTAGLMTSFFLRMCCFLSRADPENCLKTYNY